LELVRLQRWSDRKGRASWSSLQLAPLLRFLLATEGTAFTAARRRSAAVGGAWLAGRPVGVKARESSPSGDVDLRCGWSRAFPCPARSSSDAAVRELVRVRDRSRARPRARSLGLADPARVRRELSSREAGGRRSPPPASGPAAEEDLSLEFEI
jgi:hypothetical protein